MLLVTQDMSARRGELCILDLYSSRKTWTAMIKCSKVIVIELELGKPEELTLAGSELPLK